VIVIQSTYFQSLTKSHSTTLHDQLDWPTNVLTEYPPLSVQGTALISANLHGPSDSTGNTHPSHCAIMQVQMSDESYFGFALKVL
jgi:hypothetical protein